jgi:uncharacterized protein (TIGR02246 family)
MILVSISCTQKTVLSEEDKKAVETEIVQFMDTLVAAMNSASADNFYKYFLQTDEFAVATQGQLIVSPSAILDTMKVHLAYMEKQDNKPVMDKIFVITKDAAVISTSKITTITFKSGDEITMPYALTMLLVKREGKWKIAHYHN